MSAALYRLDGLCECGCGQKTRLAPQTRSAIGHVAGMPIRYVGGHQGRKPGASYEAVECGHITECWIWLRGKDEKGYPLVSVSGKTRRAHRVLYAKRFGVIPDGMTLDHLCRQRSCVNPDHLEVVTNGENVRRGWRARTDRGRSWITAARIAAELSQADLAVMVGVSQTTIGRWERGNRQPSEARLAQLKAAL